MTVTAVPRTWSPRELGAATGLGNGVAGLPPPSAVTPAARDLGCGRRCLQPQDVGHPGVRAGSHPPTSLSIPVQLHVFSCIKKLIFAAHSVLTDLKITGFLKHTQTRCLRRRGIHVCSSSPSQQHERVFHTLSPFGFVSVSHQESERSPAR